MADVSRRLEKAEKLLLKGKQQDALKEFLRAAEEDPHNDFVKLQAADLSVSLHQVNEALRLYRQVFDHQAAVNDVAAATLTYKKLSHLEKPSLSRTLGYAALIERTSRDEALAIYRSAVQQLAHEPEQAVIVQSRVVAMEASAAEYERLAELQAGVGDTAAMAESLLRAAEKSHASGDAESSFQHLERAHQADSNNRTARLRYAAALTERLRFADAARVLEPLAAAKDPEATGSYARALVECGRLEDATPFVWAQYERDPAAIAMLGELMSRYIGQGNIDAALSLAHRLEVRETGHRRRRDFILLIKDIVLRHEPDLQLLSYAGELLNSANREHDYCDVLGRLFDLYFASGQFEKAADALDRAGEVDPYDQANQQRLTALQGKLDARRYRAVAERFGKAPAGRTLPEALEENEGGSTQPTMLEDLMLQAEIFLQYGMKARAVERLQRIHRLFPDEEINNAQLHALYERAEFSPSGTPAAPAAPAAAAPAKKAAPAAADAAPAPAAKPAAPAPAARTGAEDQLGRLAEISQNIFRQAQVDAVLFTAANDIGRFLGTARCIVALCSPGAPPSAFTEYCGPHVQRSEIDALVDAVKATGKELKNQPSLFFGAEKPLPAALAKPAAALGLQSLALGRLSAREEFIGVLIAGHAAAHNWTKSEISMVPLLADQVALAASSARLRKTLDAIAPREQRTGLL
ncbi:MAG TPA: GAF domain-containing protein, partial [Terriglobales bacterium]|nr:GAF domain-containing protein [Terriglobales bacterium]